MLEFVIGIEEFRKLVRAISISGIVEQSTIEFLPDKVRAVNIDPTNVAMNYMVIEPKYFNEYNAEEATKVSFETVKLLKITKILQGNLIRVQILPEENQIKISTDEQNVTVPIMESTTKKVPTDHYVEEDENDLRIRRADSYTVIEKLPLLRQDTIESLNENETRFAVKNKILMVEQEALDGYSFSQKLKNVSSEDFSVLANSSYLKGVFTSVISSETEIYLAREQPIILKDKAQNYTMLFMLAQMLEE